MTIPLIIPPSPYLTNQKALMPLGLLYVAGYVEHMGDTCEIIDLSGVDDYINFTINKLKNINFSHLGISATSGQIFYVIKIVEQIRNFFPSVKIIGGGPHFTHTCISHRKIPERTHKFIKDFDKYFDSYVLGDGEKAIYEAIVSGKKVIDATNPLNSFYMSSKELENIPFPARHLLDIDSYVYDLGCKVAPQIRSTTIISQRGCPYGCRFCSSRTSKYGRTIRKPSNQNTINEIEHLYKTYKFTDFAFYDDEFNLNPEMNIFLNCFKDLMMKLGVELRFRAFLKSSLISPSQMLNLKNAGMTVAVIGGESGSDRILRNIGKNTSVEQNTEFVSIARDVGIHPKCIMSLGHPGESDQTLEETFQWLEKVQLSDVNFTIVSCLPSSYYYDCAVKRNDGIWVYTSPETGDRLYSFDVDFHVKPNIISTNLNYGYEATVFTDFITPEKLVEWHKRFEVKFKKQ